MPAHRTKNGITTTVEGRREYNREWNRTHPERARERERERHIRYPELARKNHLKTKYNMTIEEYNDLFNKQNGLCAICYKPESRMLNGKTVRLSVDHNHKTGTIRKLLCHACNSLLGYSKESVSILLQSVKFLNDNEYINIINEPTTPEYYW